MELFDALLVSFIEPAFTDILFLVNMEVDVLPRSHSGKDLLTQLSALWGLLFLKRVAWPDSHSSWGSSHPVTDCGRGRRAQPVNRQWYVLQGETGVDLGKISCLSYCEKSVHFEGNELLDLND